jgi:hypothetical protein
MGSIIADILVVYSDLRDIAGRIDKNDAPNLLTVSRTALKGRAEVFA